MQSRSIVITIAIVLSNRNSDYKIASLLLPNYNDLFYLIHRSLSLSLSFSLSFFSTSPSTSFYHWIHSIHFSIFSTSLHSNILLLDTVRSSTGQVTMAACMSSVTWHYFFVLSYIIPFRRCQISASEVIFHFINSFSSINFLRQRINRKERTVFFFNIVYIYICDWSRSFYITIIRRGKHYRVLFYTKYWMFVVNLRYAYSSVIIQLLNLW